MHKQNTRPAIYEELKKSNLVGIAIGHGTKIPMRHNFAVVSPINPIGSKIFIHGRDLFPDRKKVYEFFSEGCDKDKFPYDDFGEPAKEKIRRAISPEGLSGRLNDCHDIQNETEHARHTARTTRKMHPYIRSIPHHRRVNAHNAHISAGKIAKALEEYKIQDTEDTTSPEFLRDLRDSRRIYCKDKIAKAAESLKEQNVPAEFLKMAEEKLVDYVRSHDWDPESIKNFVKGVGVCKANPKIDFHVLLAKGIEARTEKILRRAAAQMANPYDFAFLEAEENSLHTLSHQDQGMLKDAINNNCAIIITDEPNLSSFSNILGYGSEVWKNGAGVYDKSHTGSNAFNSIIISSGGGKSWISAHELGHFRDLEKTGREFVRYYPTEYINYCIKKDTDHLKELETRIKSINDKNPDDNDVHWLIVMSRKIGFMLTSPPEKYELMNLCQELSLMLNQAKVHIEIFTKDDEDGYYPTTKARHTEIPAVMTQLEHSYGVGAAKALFPNLYEAFVSHRLRNESLDNAITR